MASSDSDTSRERPGEAEGGPSGQQGGPVRPASHQDLLDLARQLGLNPPDRVGDYELAGLIEDRRRLIESIPRETLAEIAVWARRTVRPEATKEDLVRMVCRLEHMRFSGLTTQGLRVLAMLRGCPIEPDDDREALKHKLKRHEGFWRKFRRKRRALVGKVLWGLFGDSGGEQRALPEEQRPLTLRERIESEGIVSGLTGRLRGAADDYIREKLDEIEARIDQKLDEMDHRLAEWRDREIANRLRIIRITLFATIVVALLSLAYTFVKSKLPGWLP